MFKYFQMILVSPTTEEYDLLHKQLLERLDTGKGEIIYDIGVGEGRLTILCIIYTRVYLSVALLY